MYLASDERVYVCAGKLRDEILYHCRCSLYTIRNDDRLFLLRSIDVGIGILRLLR